MVDVPEVLGTDELRGRLTQLLDEMAAGGLPQVVVGRQRRPEAVLVPWAAWVQKEPTRSVASGPVLGQVGDLAPWTQKESLDLEVAQDLLGQLIAWYSQEGHAEEAGTDPDPVRVSECAALVGRYAQERRSLSVYDRAAVVRVINEYGPVVRRLYHPQT